MTTHPSPPPFSPHGRHRALEAMARGELDLLVVGGGITGAGVAREAALRGLRTALVEQDDFAAGTSSRSSKIVHGGIRYLEYLQIRMVRESARERRVLRHIAPHLVHPVPFLYPVHEPRTLGKIRLGLALFDVLASSDRSERARRVKPQEVRRQLPGLRDPLRGGVRYREYITDDARLTLETAMSAALHGARVANHAQADSFLQGADGRVRGAVLRDRITGQRREVRARVVVNAGGPWASEVAASGGVELPKRIVPSKGIHILFPAERLPLEGATFLTSSTGRRGLAMRRGEWVYVGTSDEEYSGPLDRPRATRAEVAELLEMTRDCFPGFELGFDDVVSTWAGIRPLIHEEGKTTRDTSRHDEIWTTPPGLVTVAGGKLTTYRRMAQRVLARVEEQLGVRRGDAARTARTPLPGAPGVQPASLEAARGGQRRSLEEAGVPGPAIQRLTWLYGTQVDRILGYGREDPEWLAPLHEGCRALRGEVRLAVEEEMALTAADVLDRRTALLLFSRNRGRAAVEPVVEIMGELLGWDQDRRDREAEEYRERAREHGVPDAPVPSQ